MDEIEHWWNITKTFSKLEGKAANSCRMYYVEHCRKMAKHMKLPKQNFGPSVMCQHCGSLWSKNESQTRLEPGRPCSKSVKQIMRSNAEDNLLTRFRTTLLKKSLKNRMNKLIMKCSVCSKNTEISVTKPKRLKPVKKEKSDNNTAHQKKKKKKGKDKSAGLDLSGINSPDTRVKKEVRPLVTTPAVTTIKKVQKRQITPFQKVRKLNLDKLNNVLSESKAQKSKNSLNDFLKELY